MNTIELAEWLHDTYERLSKDNKWNTRKSCKVKFKDLPQNNKIVMIKLANKIIEKFERKDL